MYSLENGIVNLGLGLNQDKIKLLKQYVALLIKWNKVYSLTAITNEQQIIIYHLLDGLTVINHLFSGLHNIIDVGSGMGVPGVIIAICRPDINVWVIDSNSKKTAFLQQVAIELRLANLHVLCGRVEDHQPLVCYDMAISRAFSDASLFLEKIQHLNVQLSMLMKSSKVYAELDSIKQQWSYDLIELELPGVSDKRYLLKIYTKTD